MKRFVILIVYFLFLYFQYFLEAYSGHALKITTVFSKIGDAVLLSSYGGSQFLLLGNIDYGLDRYIDERIPGPCFIDYVYITSETNLVTFYRILGRCAVGTVFYQEKDFYARKINLKVDSILKTQSLASLEDKINLDLNGVSVTVYGEGGVEFRGDGVSFLASSSRELMSVKRKAEGSEIVATGYLKPPFNAVNGSINPLLAKNILCSFKICLRNPEEYEVSGTNIIRSEDGESIVVKR